MDRVLALIMAGGSSETLGALTECRAEAALQFGGKFRLIDFPLSNLTNSQIYNVGILTQYMPRTLNDHIGIGKPWDLDRTSSGIRLLQPYMGGKYGGWQRGNADAVRRNLDYIANQQVDHVLILAGDHIYLMDYRPMLQQHLEYDSTVTVATRFVSSPQDAFRYGMVVVDDQQRLLSFEEKPRRSARTLASMGIYVFKVQDLAQTLTDDPQLNDFGRDFIPHVLAQGATIHSYEFSDYWADVGTVQAYWEANMGLIADEPALNLYNRQWVVHTRSEILAPVFVGPHAEVSNNLISNGCVIEGHVHQSVLSPGVNVKEGAQVRDSVILRNVVVEEGAQVNNCVVDENTVIESEALVGHGPDECPNQILPDVLNTGLTLIGQHARLPAGVKIGRNVQVHSYASHPDFPESLHVPCGGVTGLNPRRG